MSGYYSFVSKNEDGKSEDMYIGLVQRGDTILGDVSGIILFFCFHIIILCNVLILNYRYARAPFLWGCANK
jgi:hypothetical protein